MNVTRAQSQILILWAQYENDYGYMSLERESRRSRPGRVVQRCVQSCYMSDALSQVKVVWQEVIATRHVMVVLVGPVWPNVIH